MRFLTACLVLLMAVSLMAVPVSAQDSTTDSAADPVVLVVHGGAGTIRRSDLDADTEAAIRAALTEALRAGHARIAAGDAPLDAVAAAIEILEDDPHFNAGRGGVFAADGTVRHDASIMDGTTGLAGASSGTQHVRHPIRLARAVMEASPHVILSGSGAEEFALQQGLELVSNEFFQTPGRRAALDRVQQRERDASGMLVEPAAWQMTGTVGAVANAGGRIAAGTSTGGMTNKRWGRIGDSPVIGAGTFADPRCGVSSTGHGEFFLRLGVARDIAARVEYLGETCAEAATHVIQTTLAAAGGTGGVIALGADGSWALPFNTDGMYRGTITAGGVVTTGVYGDEE